MNPNEALEAIEAIRSTVPELDRPQLDLSLARLALPPSVYEQITHEAPLAQITSNHEAPGNADILATLTPEKRQRAKTMQTAFAEHFSTIETPLAPEDFGLVVVSSQLHLPAREQLALPDAKTVAMLTTGNGLHMGSYDSVMSNKKKNEQNFTVEVDGEEIDTREAMTWETYQAFIAQAKTSGTDPLPDSRKLSRQNGQPHTGTWLTGEPATEFGADYGFVFGDGPDRKWHVRDNAWNILRVRPAAVV